MSRRRLEALERLLPPAPSCRCIVAYCPQQGESEPDLAGTCPQCGLERRDEFTLVQEIIVETREQAVAVLALCEKGEEGP
jgi:hypothetical protein